MKFNVFNDEASTFNVDPIAKYFGLRYQICFKPSKYGFISVYLNGRDADASKFMIKGSEENISFNLQFSVLESSSRIL